MKPYLPLFVVVVLPPLAFSQTVCVGLSGASSGFLEAFSGRLEAAEVPLRVLAGELPTVPQDCVLVVSAGEDGVAKAVLAEAAAGAEVLLLALKARGTHQFGHFIHATESIPALESLLRFFNWTNVSLIYSADEFGYTLRNKLSATGVEAMVTVDSTEESVRRTLIRKIRQQGSNIVVVGTTANVAVSVLPLLYEEKLVREGDAAVVVGDAVWGLPADGVKGLLVLKEADCLSATTTIQCDADRVAAIIRRVSEVLRIPIIDLKAHDVWTASERYSEVLQSRLIVANTQLQGLEAVCEFTADMEVKQTAEIYFPGRVTKVPQWSLRDISISFNSGLENPSLPPTTVAEGLYRGQRLAVLHINESNELLNKHRIVSTDVSFGAAQWNESWATPRIRASADRLGLAYLAGYASVVTAGTMKVMQKLNISRPVIGSSNSMVDLGNSTQFPWFLRNGVSDTYFAALYVNIMPVLGWKRCAVMYEDNSYGTSVYTKFKQLSAYHGIAILNEERLRKVPILPSKQDYLAHCRDQLLELFRSNARLVILFALEPTPRYILEALFDLGARKGDFVFSGSWVSATYVRDGPELRVMKFRELLEGTVVFSGSAWIGAVGASVHSAFLAQFNESDPSPFACFYYDSVFAVALAIDNCQAAGYDYEEPHKLMKFLRETRFVGCSGFVSWLSGENNRAFADYTILNLVREHASGNYSLVPVGRYSPTSTQLFNFSAPLRFADGSTTPPPDLRVVFADCPFEEKLRRRFTAGWNLTVGVYSIFVFFTVLASAITYRKSRSMPIPMMQRREISVEDVSFMVATGIEVAQLIALGPDLSNLSPTLKKTAKVAIADFSETRTYRDGGYWDALTVAMSLVALFLLLCLLRQLKLSRQLRLCGLTRIVDRATYVLLPLLGGVCFLPLLSIQLEAFSCVEAVGRGHLSYTHSILTIDCYAHCWSTEHSIYAALSCFCVLSYIVLVVIRRMVWQDCQHDLHIKVHPHFATIKSLAEVVLLCLSKTLRRWHPVANGVAFVCIVSGLCGFVCRYGACNYSRMSLWQGLSFAGAAVLAVASLVSEAVEQRSYVVLAVGGTWVLLVVAGLIVQRRYFPSLLYQRAGRDFAKLIKFAFTRLVSADEVRPQLNFANEDSSVQASDVEIRVL